MKIGVINNLSIRSGIFNSSFTFGLGMQFHNLDIEKMKEKLNQKMKKDIVFNSLFLFTSDSHDLKSRV